MTTYPPVDDSKQDEIDQAIQMFEEKLRIVDSKKPEEEELKVEKEKEKESKTEE